MTDIKIICRVKKDFCSVLEEWWSERRLTGNEEKRREKEKRCEPLVSAGEDFYS